MNSTIVSAISSRELLSFSYDGQPRLVEPHAYGVSTAGNESLRAYQVGGGHASIHSGSWHLFSTSKIVGLKKSGTTFSGPRPGYKRNDQAMHHIYAQL